MNNKNININENIVIRDIKSICLSIVAIIVGIYLLIVNFDYFGAGTFAPLAIIGIASFRLKVIYGGIKIDINNDTLSFPGGGISFNSIEETISNLHQFFRRYTHKISSIQYIKTVDKKTISKKGEISYTYILTFTSVQNTVNLKFSSSAKRDQVYSLIVNINDMGAPINIR